MLKQIQHEMRRHEAQTPVARQRADAMGGGGLGRLFGVGWAAGLWLALPEGSQVWILY